jgi:hypothetical protein
MMSFKDGLSPRKEEENLFFMLRVMQQQFERMNMRLRFGEVFYKIKRQEVIY